MSRARTWLLGLGCVLLIASTLAWLASDGVLPDPDKASRVADDHAELAAGEPFASSESQTPERPSLRPTEVGTDGGGSESAAPGSTIRGRLTASDTGAGILGAWVRLVRRETEEGARTVRTNAAGAFEAANLPPGEWILLPLHLRYTHPFTTGLLQGEFSNQALWRYNLASIWKQARAAGLVVDLSETARQVDGLEIVLSPGARIHGRVLDPAGNPAAHVSIFMDVPDYAAADSIDHSVSRMLRAFPLMRTDAQGQFEFHGFAENLRGIRLGVRHAEWLGRWSEPITIGDQMPIELTLHASARITGTVRWENGGPEAGASVSLRRMSKWIFPQGEKPRTRTDERGDFTLAPCPPESLKLWARPADRTLSSTEVEISALTQGEVREGVQVLLEARTLLRGVLVSPAGKPLEGECVVAYAPDNKQDYLDLGHTDDDGAFQLELFSDDPVDLFIETGNRVELLARTVDPTGSHRFTVEPTPVLTARVRVNAKNGAPVSSFMASGGTVVDGGSDNEETEEGELTLTVRGLPPYWVSVEAPTETTEGRNAPRGSAYVRVETPGKHDLQISLEQRAVFFGHVVDDEGKAVVGASIAYEIEGVTHTHVVDDSGTFEIRPDDASIEELELTLTALPAGYRDADGATTARRGVFEAIRVASRGEALHGRLVVEGEAPASLADIPVYLSWSYDPDSTYWEETTEVRTDDAGRFVAYAIPRGERVKVECMGHNLAAHGLVPLSGRGIETEFRTGSEAVTLRAKVGKSIRGRIEGPGLQDIDYERLRLCTIEHERLFGWWHLQTLPTEQSPEFEVLGLESTAVGLALLEEGETRRVLAWAPPEQVQGDSCVLRVPRLRGVLRGRLQLGDLAPSEPVRLRVYLANVHNFDIPVEVDEDGAFLVERLDSSARFTLRAEIETASGTWVAQAYNVKSGDTVRLVPGKPLTIRGRVLRGENSKGTIVQATRHGQRYYAFVVSDTGAFELKGLTPGSYALVVVDGELRPRGPVRTAEAGETDVELARE